MYRIVSAGPTDQLPEALRRGLEHCRLGEWENGLYFLGKIAEAGRTGLPGTFYSYLGYGIARCQGRTAEGLKLCRHAVKIEFYDLDNWVNLARTALLDDNRGEAVRAVTRGLKVDRNNQELQALYVELGIRRSPVLRFLSRSNLLNLILGKIRSQIFGTRTDV